MIRRNSFKAGSGSSQKITIRLLDDNEVIQVDFQSHHKGQFLMDYICRQLNIAEKDYFGLRHVDSNKQRHWLDLGKSILKQLKEMTPYIVCVRFKFYPSDPMLLKEEVSRYQLVLQLRRDILHGRLYSTLSDMATLASFIIQSELADYDPELHRGNYVAEFELVSRQTAELEEKVIELHQKLKGLTPAESDLLFLKKAATLDTYGVDPHPVKDQQGDQLYLGINHTGISTFQGSKKSTHFKWSQITKLNYEAKMFIVHLSIAEDSRTKKKETVGFKCQTSSSCKYLWRCAVEQRLFYNCGCTTDIPTSVRGGGIFGSRFRYSGRVQREILEDPGPLRASDSAIQRTPLYRSLQRNKTRSLPHSPLQLGYGSLPRSNHSAPPHESTRLEGALGSLGSSTSLPLSTLSSPYCPDHQLPLLETLQEDSPREDKENESNLEILTGDISEEVKTETTLYLSSVASPGQNEAETKCELFVETTLSNTRSTSLPLASPTTLQTLVSIKEEPESGATSEAEYSNNYDPNQTAAVEKNVEVVLEFTSSNGRLLRTRKIDLREPPITNAHTAEISNNPDPSFRSKLVKVEAVDLGNSREEPLKMEQSVPSHNHSISTEFNPENKGFDETKVCSESGTLNHLDSNGNNRINKNLIGATISNVGTSSASEPISVKSAFLPGYHHQEQEDGYEVVPNDSDHLLRESRIDQIASQSQTPVTPTTRIISVNHTTQEHVKKSSQAILSIGKIFIVCLICVLIALVSVAIVAIEVDIDICRRMRKIPEVEMFQNELYEPIKNFVWSKLHNPNK